MNPTAAIQPARLESLDSIRGLAALFVLFGHTLGLFDWPKAYSEWSQWPILNILVDGRSAVTMFFVLSGFVLARPFLTKTNKKIFIPAFYVRRITRIWLPWFFIFLASLAARHWLMPPPGKPPMSSWMAGFWHQHLTWKDIIKQCVFQLHVPSRLMMPQDWSLGVELKGSFLLPFFLIMARHRWHWCWLGASAAFFFTFIHTGGYYISFIFGVVLAQYSEQLIGKLKQAGMKEKLALLALGICGYEARWFAGYCDFTDSKIDQFVWVITSFSCVIIILTSLSSLRISCFLTRRPIVFAGKISYSVYLLQFMVLICFVTPLIQWLDHVGFGFFELFIFTFLSSLAITLMLGWLIYWCVEVPSITLGHWISGIVKSVNLLPATVSPK